MRGRSSVLSEEQREKLQVENFIYHIIKNGEEQPEYLDEVHLANDRQKSFFRNIIAETGEGTQYKFINESSNFQRHCKEIVENPHENFTQQSRDLAQEFLSRHTTTNMSDGVFIVARVTIPINTVRTSFIALIKLDYTPVMRQHRTQREGNVVELEEVLEALSEQKASVQKRALIDMSNSFEWDVLAVERRKTGKELDTEDAITEYFKNFMGIRLKQNDSSLTKQIVSECYRWANQCAELEGKTPSDIRHIVISLMDGYADRQIDYDDVKNTVCIHSNPEKSERIKKNFDNFMADNGLKGISFAPKPKSIPGRSRKGIWETDTGIQIIWEGERTNKQLKVEHLADGSVKIIIRANTLIEKD